MWEKERKQRESLLVKFYRHFTDMVHSSALADHSRLKLMKNKARTAKHRCSSRTFSIHSTVSKYRWVEHSQAKQQQPTSHNCKSVKSDKSLPSASASKLHLPHCNTFSTFHTSLGLQQWESEKWGQEKKRKNKHIAIESQSWRDTEKPEWKEDTKPQETQKKSQSCHRHTLSL